VFWLDWHANKNIKKTYNNRNVLWEHLIKLEMNLMSMHILCWTHSKHFPCFHILYSCSPNSSPTKTSSFDHTMSTNHNSMFNYNVLMPLQLFLLSPVANLFDMWYVGTKKISLQIMWFDHIETIMKYSIFWFTSKDFIWTFFNKQTTHVMREGIK